MEKHTIIKILLLNSLRFSRIAIQIPVYFSLECDDLIVKFIIISKGSTYLKKIPEEEIGK